MRYCQLWRAPLAHGNITHGESRCRGVVAEYTAWCSMRQRCLDPNCGCYCRYGGRGITVCPEWESYEQFLSDMGRRPSPSHQIDRKDNNGPYAPWNCSWATRAEQARNRRSTKLITYSGETKCLADWAAVIGKPWWFISQRLRRGWSVEKALQL